MSRDRIYVMSFGLGGNSGDGITKAGNTYSSSWYLNGPDEFVKLIPEHYDPGEVDGCLVIDKREVLEASPGPRDSGADVQRPPGRGRDRPLPRHQGRRKQPGASGVRPGRWPATVPGGPRCNLPRGQEQGARPARLRRPGGLRRLVETDTVLAWVCCIANPARRSNGHRLPETPRRTPLWAQPGGLAWGRIVAVQDELRPDGGPCDNVAIPYPKAVPSIRRGAPSITARRFAEGVFFVSTPSHGGFKLEAKHNLLIPAAFRREGGWYEEDCDAAIPMFFMPLLFKPEQVHEARQSLRNWHWRAWEAHFR